VIHDAIYPVEVILIHDAIRAVIHYAIYPVIHYAI
jgi:hypothetical protein